MQRFLSSCKFLILKNKRNVFESFTGKEEVAAMTKLNCIDSVKKTVSIITMAGFLGLSTLQPAIGFESEPYGIGTESQVVGIGFSGSLDFKNLRITGFSYSPMKGMQGNFSAANDSMLRTEDGLVKVDLPLFTFGDDIKYPGIFYNHNGNQFYQYIINSTEGDKAAQMAMTPYILLLPGLLWRSWPLRILAQAAATIRRAQILKQMLIPRQWTLRLKVPEVVETPVQVDETAQPDQEAAGADSQTPTL